MSYFRALAHLEEQLGQEGFEALIASANTGQVKAFCDALLAGRPRSAYSVAIDYSMSIEQMVSAGRYDWSDANIVSKNFPVDGTGIITTTPELVHLGRKASS
ncbi:hypothetical protein KJ673_02755, partial [Patescibacteria group bacterium]|nr:hypothetical protein [Patescibacteria group bacterium]